MNPKHLNIRMDRQTGEFWLTEEKYLKPVRKVANMTAPIMLSLCAEAEFAGGTGGLEKDVRFSDGTGIRISVTPLPTIPNAIN